MVSPLHLLEVAHDGLHVLLKIHWGALILSLTLSERAHLVNQERKLSLDVELVLAVNLESDILDLIGLEGDEVLLTSQEKREGDLEQDVLDVRLDELSGVHELHAHCEELDGQSKSSGANELLLSLHQKLEVNLVESLNMLILELFDEVVDDSLWTVLI